MPAFNDGESGSSVRAKINAAIAVADSIAFATQAEAEAGTDNAKYMTPLRVAQAARPKRGTPVTASGTLIDFTGIPSWATRVTVLFGSLSTNGTAALVVRLGSSGGVEATGYTGNNVAVAGGSVAALLSTGFNFSLTNADIASAVRSGSLTLVNVSGNIWVAQGSISNDSAAIMSFVSGVKTLSGVLDRIRITTSNGTDSFDAGTVNVIWE